ncbi:MAG TPA: nucleotidyltransferase domain-containing protein [Ohtaekwangia sp.]|uniref:nucleotidyltransferase domain-containing protein n=1 Tax=Ohtaekwangia sp. TaxID=2066019 RepID=UPI002F94B1E0
MRQIIMQKLDSLQKDHRVKILYACESGSRAWGFASPDSDFDVRFIYVNRSDEYLSINEHRDVIELPINEVLDINGWDIRKALRLFRKSNAPLYEWLQSPVVYMADQQFVNDMQYNMPRYFSARSMMHHYIGMAKTAYDTILAGDEVRIKKYFYALRPLLACRWIADRSEVPPMEFAALRVFLPNDLQGIVDELLEIKARGDEKYTINRIVVLHEYIREQLDRCLRDVPEIRNVADDIAPLNKLFRKYIV